MGAFCRFLPLIVATLLPTQGAAQTTPSLPIVEVTPRFVEGVHTACDVRFVDRMPFTSGFPSHLGAGTISLRLEDGLHVFLKLGFSLAGENKAPATAYLIEDYQTNYIDLRGSKVLEDGYHLSLFSPDTDTLSAIIGSDDADRTITVGYTVPDQTSFQFNVVMSASEHQEWTQCVGALLTRWIEQPE